MTMVELLSCAEWKGPSPCADFAEVERDSAAAEGQILKGCGHYFKAIALRTEMYHAGAQTASKSISRKSIAQRMDPMIA
jgi:hypothetical protein